MFERFTNRARRVLVVAQTEARSLGHSFIRPEHVFLGLLEGDGVAAKVLARHGVQLELARETFAASIASSEEAKHTANVPFSAEAKRTLELSLREALRLGHNYIGTEHILLALVSQSDAGGWLTAVTGEDPAVLGSAVEEMLVGHASDRRRSPAVNRTMARAQAVAGKAPLTTGHLLRSMLEDDRSLANIALRELGLDKDAVEAALARIPVEETSDTESRPRRVELRVGESTVTVEDPIVADALMNLTPEELRAVLRKALGGQRRRRKPPRAS